MSQLVICQLFAYACSLLKSSFSLKFLFEILVIELFFIMSGLTLFRIYILEIVWYFWNTEAWVYRFLLLKVVFFVVAIHFDNFFVWNIYGGLN